MKIETGTLVKHKDNPSWRAVIVRDTDPRKTVNGMVVVYHNGREAKMFKSLLKKVNW